MCVCVCVFVNPAYLYKCDSVCTRQPNHFLYLKLQFFSASIHCLPWIWKCFGPWLMLRWVPESRRWCSLPWKWDCYPAFEHNYIQHFYILFLIISHLTQTLSLQDTLSTQSHSELFLFLMALMTFLICSGDRIVLELALRWLSIYIIIIVIIVNNHHSC